MNIIKKINVVLDEGFEEGDMVKVIGNVVGKGSIGKVIDISPQGSFYIVKIGNKTHSYHESDIQLKKKVNEEGESGATVVANVEKNPAVATNMVRRTPPELTHPECGKGQRWCTIKKACVPDPRVSEGGYSYQDGDLLKRYVELKGNKIKIDHHANQEFLWNEVAPGGYSGSVNFDGENIDFDSAVDAKKWYAEFERLIKRKDFMKAYQKQRHWMD